MALVPYEDDRMNRMWRAFQGHPAALAALGDLAYQRGRRFIEDQAYDAGAALRRRYNRWADEPNDRFRGRQRTRRPEWTTSTSTAAARRKRARDEDEREVKRDIKKRRVQKAQKQSWFPRKNRRYSRRRKPYWKVYWKKK